MATPTTEDRAARMALAIASEPGDETTGKLLEQLGAAATLDLVRSPGATARIDPTEIELWRRRLTPRLDQNAAERVAGSTEHLGLRMLTPQDLEWPAELNRLGIHAPIALWTRGSTGPLAAGLHRQVSMIGARAATRYGEHIASELAAELAGGGHFVLSGGAYGIDGAAHRAAMSARPGGTVAIVATGLDRPYPVGHDNLFAQIVESGGLLVSELPPGSVPTRWRYMQRNRLLAVLTGTTIVVEAGYRSGALDIARRARDLGHPVGAVPGPVTSAASAGCHRLLKEGEASVVTSATDVIELLGTRMDAALALDRRPISSSARPSGMSI